MKKTILTLICFSILSSLNLGFSQIPYLEDFNTGAPSWTTNTVTGAEGAGSNEWYISCQEEGVGTGICGSACTLGDQTLHISTNSGGIGDVGAAYLEGGGGLTDTDRRSESGDISTVGETNLSLSFDLIGAGGGTDFCELLYSIDGGGSWTVLDPTLTTLCCGGVACDGVLQGLWQTNTYALPVACEGIPNLRIGFRWQNVDDGIATDPSVAIDNLRITTTTAGAGPTAEFTMAPGPSICVGETITFTDASTTVGAVTYDWVFTGGAPATAGTVGPHAVTFNTPGAFPVTLTVTDDDGTDDTTVTVTVNPPPAMTVSATPSDIICTEDDVILTASGADSYVWTGGVTNGVPFVPGTTTTYTVTGEITATGCQASVDITITVIDCVPLIAGFSYPDPVCADQCFTLTDTSLGNASEWQWDFGGASTDNTDSVQNPTVCFDEGPGTYDIQLTVTDVAGQTSSTTNTITVYSSPKVTTSADTCIDLGGSVELVAYDTIPDLTYLWEPDYFVNCTDCPVTFGGPEFDTTYTVTVTDTNGCTATDMVDVCVNFLEGVGVPTAFSPNADGNNDVLYVKGTGITQMNFKVYNKYGEKVFETQEQNIGWDGTYLGMDQNPGVFVWVLEYSFINGNGGIQKGNTTLIR